MLTVFVSSVLIYTQATIRNAKLTPTSFFFLNWCKKSTFTVLFTYILLRLFLTELFFLSFASNHHIAAHFNILKISIYLQDLIIALGFVQTTNIHLSVKLIFIHFL